MSISNNIGIPNIPYTPEDTLDIDDTLLSILSPSNIENIFLSEGSKAVVQIVAFNCITLIKDITGTQADLENLSIRNIDKKLADIKQQLEAINRALTNCT